MYFNKSDQTIYKLVYKQTTTPYSMTITLCHLVPQRYWKIIQGGGGGMIGAVIITHGRLGEELLNVVEFIIGKQ